jgi:N-sulfoglucosamine sulfohydrolase
MIRLLSCLLLLLHALAVAQSKPNILLLTADDMNYDALGFTGSKVPGISPHLDKLAAEGMWFKHAHVTVAVCQPSRQCLLTGRYPHRNGSVGFYPVSNDVTTMAEVLKQANFHLGILGKVIHLRPVEKFPWHYERDEGVLGRGRDPQKYYEYSKEFLQQAKDTGKPFFLMANSHDPHRPFAGSEGMQPKNYPAPPRTYKPEEITVPGFLPDLPDIRKELAQYYSSVNRCDQSFGEVLRALEESGLADNTIVIFLSDNGIAMPFAKSNCYLTSTRTPWLMRWPGKITAGTVDRENFISSIDFMPTVLDILGLPMPEGSDGRSFQSLLKGEKQAGREKVVTCYNEAFGKKAYPMRCLQDKRFGYIYNSWSDGKKTYNTEGMSGLSFKAMRDAAANDKEIAARVEMVVHRVPEELYDFAADPSALKNLIDDPAFAEQRKAMRGEMLSWMEKTADPLLPKFKELVQVAKAPFDKNIHLAQGLMSGEVTATSAILQTRLTAVAAITEGKVSGKAGVGCFQISPDAEFKESQLTPWLKATEEKDFILRATVDHLQPATRYYYRVLYCTKFVHFPSVEQSPIISSVASFKTLPAKIQATPVSFVLTSCLNYAFFKDPAKNTTTSAEDRKLGYPALDPILKIKPDFLIINGDCVYYDHPYNTRAKTLAEMRNKWHEQYSMPRFVQLFASTPVYWNKDDHDYRMNDADGTGDYAPSPELGSATFREQVPIVKNDSSETPTYRTHRVGRDLQLWFVEGRDYRSPNKMPDGPEKTIWGAEQKAWLQRTIKESDATYKILISATPMIGPDDASKNDNHANAGFHHEGAAFFDWLKENKIDPARFFILCGDRHWKYLSRHPYGYQEFSCGALNRENARLGRAPGTRGSSDPRDLIHQAYTDATPSGGFLHVRLIPGEDEQPHLEILHCDDAGKTLHSHITH